MVITETLYLRIQGFPRKLQPLTIEFLSLIKGLGDLLLTRDAINLFSFYYYHNTNSNRYCKCIFFSHWTILLGISAAVIKFHGNV